jgi:hypothetical protein
MPLTEQEIATIEKVEAQIRELASTPLEALLRSELEERARFEPLRIAFASYLETAQLVSQLDLRRLPSDARWAVTQFANEFTALRDEVQKYSLTNPNRAWDRERERIISVVNDKHQKRPRLTAEVALGTAIAARETEREAISRLEALASEAEQKKVTLAELEDRANGLVAALETTVQKTTIATHAQVFLDEASRNGKHAIGWLLAGGGVGLVLLWVVTKHLAEAIGGSGALAGPAPVNVGEAIHETVAKLIAYSVVGTLLLWIGRMYRAARHNEVVNRHRSNALKCFEALTRSTTDPATHSAILIQATQSIFSPQVTGFSDKDGESTGGNQVFEIYRSMSAPNTSGG